MPDGKLSTGQLDVLNDKPIAADSDQDSLDDDVYHDLATGPIVKKPVTSMYHSSNSSIATTNRLIATQFAVNTPEIMKQKLAKNGSESTKCKQPPGDADTQEEEARAPTTAKEKKKKKSKPAKKKNNFESESKPKPKPITLTIYCYIRKPDPPLLPRTGCARAPVKPPSPQYLQKDPFHMQSSLLFEEFLLAVAKVLPCPVQNIPKGQITWKAKKAALNAVLIALGGEVGYEALLEMFATKKQPANRHVYIFMPPPTKPEEETPVSLPSPCTPNLLFLT